MFFRKKEKVFVMDNGDDSGVDYSELSGLEYEEMEDEDDIEFRDAYLKETIYDESGETVNCEWCDDEIIFKNNEFICPSCGRTYDRDYIMNIVGGEVHNLNGPL